MMRLPTTVISRMPWCSSDILGNKVFWHVVPSNLSNERTVMLQYISEESGKTEEYKGLIKMLQDEKEALQVMAYLCVYVMCMWYNYAMHFGGVGQTRRIQRLHQNTAGWKRGFPSNGICIYSVYIYICMDWVQNRRIQRLCTNCSARKRFSSRNVMCTCT